MTYLEPRQPAHTHSDGKREEETERGALPQQLLQLVSEQMFHLQCLSVPMLLQTGETDCNNTEGWSSMKFVYRFHGFILIFVSGQELTCHGIQGSEPVLGEFHFQ
jgi:hypothetical protein